MQKSLIEDRKTSTSHTSHSSASAHFVTAQQARLFSLTPVRGYGLSLVRIPSLFARFPTSLATRQNTAMKQTQS